MDMGFHYDILVCSVSFILFDRWIFQLFLFLLLLKNQFVFVSFYSRQYFVFLFPFGRADWVILCLLGTSPILNIILLNIKAYWVMTFFLYFSFIANTYLFMVQARGIMLRENVKTIGHMIRLYTNKNSTLNGTGKTTSCLTPCSHKAVNQIFYSLFCLQVTSC